MDSIISKYDTTIINDIIVINNVEHINPLILDLKDSEQTKFEFLTDVFAADFPLREHRFEIVYNLLSIKYNKRIVLKYLAKIDENIPTICNIFEGANWYEREIFDMFGIHFKGHPDMSRILTDYGFVGHPLRKDFPVYGHVELSYDKKSCELKYEKVDLHQQFREFDFESEWAGPKYILPGDEKASS